jgi:hypothetical protein
MLVIRHMNQLLQKVQALVARSEILVSLHGSEELAADLVSRGTMC